MKFINGIQKKRPNNLYFENFLIRIFLQLLLPPHREKAVILQPESIRAFSSLRTKVSVDLGKVAYKKATFSKAVQSDESKP